MNASSQDVVYRLCRRAEWQVAEADGAYVGGPLDAADGFIHLSTAAQVRETARVHLAGVADLLLIEVDAGALGDALRWEASRGGALFPHLYAQLPLTAVRRVAAVALDPARGHVFPGWL